MRLLFKIIAKIIAIPLYLVFGLLGIVFNMILGLGMHALGFVLTLFVVFAIVEILSSYWPGVIFMGVAIASIFLIVLIGAVVLQFLGDMRDFFRKVIVY